MSFQALELIIVSSINQNTFLLLMETDHRNLKRLDNKTMPAKTLCMQEKLRKATNSNVFQAIFAKERDLVVLW